MSPFSLSLSSRRRDSAPVQRLPALSITPDPSSSLHSINLTVSSTDQLHLPAETCQSSNMSLVDEDRLQSAKETEILEVDSDIEDGEDSDESQENTYENTKSPIHPKAAPRSIYDVLPPTPPNRPSSAHIDPTHSTPSTSSSSRLTSTNEQQIIDIDTALREVLSGIRTVEECHAQCFRTIPTTSRQSDERLSTGQEADAPDLVLNLPISSGLVTPPATKSLDTNLHDHQSSKSNSSSNSSPSHQSLGNHIITQSAIIPDSNRTSRSNSCSNTTVSFIEKIRPSPEPIHRKKVPPPIMKKPEKTVELLKRLGISAATESLCGATSSSSLTSSSTSSTHVFLTQSQAHPQPIHVLGSSKTTDV